MTFSFDGEVAKLCGVNAAVLFFNICFWVAENEKNGRNYHEGKYWTYNSVKDFGEKFIFLSRDQIDYALQKLIEAGLIIKGNFNKSSYDRRLWYSITEKAKSISEKSEMEKAPIPNGNGNSTKSYNTYNKQSYNSQANHITESDKGIDPKEVDDFAKSIDFDNVKL